MTKKTAIDAVLNTVWAIEPSYLDTIAAIASREHEYANNLDALEAKLGRPLGNTMAATIREGVAVIPIEGPLFAKANIMTQFSGATSYDMLALDFMAALDNPSVNAILFREDTPGGQVTGASEMAQLIASARGKKPIVAHVTGSVASAGYWIASACDAIYCSDTAIAGSIGAQMGIKVATAKDGEKSYTFVSSQSPYKNAGPETDAGKSEIQGIVDGMAQVFIDAVAKNRNTTPENVAKSYGAGSVFIASEALARGMIDGIQTFEQTFSNLKNEVSAMDYKDLSVTALTENRPDIVAAIKTDAIAGVEKVDAAAERAAGAKAERERITQIESLAVAGAEPLIAKFKAEGTEYATAAIEIVKHVQAQGSQSAAAALATVKATETNMPKPAVTGSDDSGAVDEVEAMLAIGKSQGIC